MRWMVLSLCGTMLGAGVEEGEGTGRMNVLFIAVDDLRPELGCYGAKGMVTPHLDGLAKEGRVFRRHYVQAPTCGASRFALLTGKRPRSTASYGNGAFGLLRQRGGEKISTLPGSLKKAGYFTVSIGKVSHQPDGRNYRKEAVGGDGAHEVPGAWDKVLMPSGKWKTGWGAFFGYSDGSARKRGKSPTYEKADVGDQGYPDGLIADEAVRQLKRLKNGKKPWFLAVGFFKPHLPFTAPRQYWDLYDRKKIELAKYRERPKSGGGAKYSTHGSGELLGNYGGHPGGRKVGVEYARTLKHAYSACVSYVDAQVGRVLQALREMGLVERTVVIVWGDHGWHLGENGVWGKHTLYERSLRSVLMVRTPRMKGKGEASDALVETIDIYPTVLELCGVKSKTALDGRSFVKVLKDARRRHKDGAIGYWRRGKVLGMTLRTDKRRLVRWYEAKGGKDVHLELYDHEKDGDEVTNLAKERAGEVTRLLDLMKRLDKGGVTQSPSGR